MIRLSLRLSLLLALLAVPAWAGDLPPDSVPGAINPAVTQATIAQTICVPNWTDTIRPPVSYTNKLKAAKMQALGLVGDPHNWELDHRVPLSVGGDPRSPANLYPQLWDGPYGARVKDVMEALIHRRICHGQMTLAEGRAIFLAPHDWRDDYDKIYGPRGPHSTPLVNASAH